MVTTENLALTYQEIFTVIVRVRSSRQVARNAEVFRANMRGLLKKAEQQSVAQGYPTEDARLASFAVVAFLDESLQISSDSIFSDWKRLPLQQELFKTGNAGEEFFRALEDLRRRPDTPQLADLLEVYYLCLLLGFQGRESAASLHTIKQTLAQRIGRIRGASQPLSATWAPGGGPIPVTRADPWVRRLMVTAVVILLVAVGLFAGFKLTLDSGVSRANAAVSASSP